MKVCVAHAEEISRHTGEIPFVYPASWSTPRARAKRFLLNVVIGISSLALWLLLLSPIFHLLM